MFFVRCHRCGARCDLEAALDEGWREACTGVWLCPTHTDDDRSRGFDEPEDGSEQRYRARWVRRPWAAHTLWWLIHNTIAHPLIGLVPVRRMFAFHDWTSRKMHGR